MDRETMLAKVNRKIQLAEIRTNKEKAADELETNEESDSKEWPKTENDTSNFKIPTPQASMNIDDFRHVVKAKLHINPHEILRLIYELSERDVKQIQITINIFAAELTGAETAFILKPTLLEDQVQIQAVGDKVVEDTVKFSIKNSNFETAINRKKSFATEDVDMGVCQLVTYLIKKKLKSCLCIPISNDSKVYLLMCLVNKKNVISELPKDKRFDKALLAFSEFTNDDELIIHEIFTYITPIVYKAFLYEDAKATKKSVQELLEIAYSLLSHIEEPQDLLEQIMKESKKLMKAQKSVLFIVDKPQKQLIASIQIANENQPAVIRMSMEKGVTGYVATNGVAVNIKDSTDNPLFNKKFDNLLNIKTKNILCFPIIYQDNVVAVIELLNKKNALHFTQVDLDLANTFAAHCALIIHHAIIWKDIMEAHHRIKLSNEFLMYHMKISVSEIEELATIDYNDPEIIEKGLKSFKYNPRSCDPARTLVAAVFMFCDLEFPQTWNIPMPVLVKFMLLCKKGYRNPPYHNWMHAFSVAHFSYLMLSKLKLMETHLTTLEGFVLLTSSFCHDLDHRGTTNSFQMISKSNLAALYSSDGSVLERHHLSQAITILNTEGCNIFDSLDANEYAEALDLMKDIIIATDLAEHFKSMSNYRKLIEVGYDYYNEDHHNLLLSLIITSSDLNDQTKNWTGVKRVAQHIYLEFFSQGDIEKSLGQKPIEMFDRERACIPDLQIGFLDGVIFPLYTLLSSLFPKLEYLLRTIKRNRQIWNHVKDLLSDSKQFAYTDVMELFKDPILEAEIEKYIETLKE